MPADNNFQPEPYARANPGERVAYRAISPSAPPGSVAWLDEMARLGRQMADAGVRGVVFVHGSHLGADLFGMQRLDQVGGLKRGYSRGISGLDALLALMREETNGLSKPPGGLAPPLSNDPACAQQLDRQVGDACNFTAGSVERFATAVGREAAKPIVCTRYLWSSEHHHLGRALAACRLLAHCAALCREQELGPGDRLLIQAHGHTGPAVALLSNLLAPDESPGRDAVLTILHDYLEQTGSPERGLMPEIRTALAGGKPLNGVALDVATYGAPLRYGWDTGGIGKLLHVVNHRPLRTDGKPWLAKMDLPQITFEMPIAWGGDYVQQLTVNGSDAMPTTPEAQAANKALWEILEGVEGFERWLECARRTVRCPSDGLCLLVDYKDGGTAEANDPRAHVYGHAAYTREAHLLFNTTELVRTLYA